MTDIAAEFCEVVNASLRCGSLDAIDDTALRGVLTAAIKAYAAKSEAAGGELRPCGGIVRFVARSGSAVSKPML